MRTLKICVILGIIFSLVLVSFAFAEEQKPGKKYDLRFSLSGGTIKGNFALNGEFAYARNYSGLFAQVSTMANVHSGISEYGASLGMGTQGEVFQVYVFLDTLYREKLWAQVRPIIRLDFDWLSIGGYYAYPLQSSPLQIGYRTISPAKYFGAEFNLIPAPWLKLYGNLNSVEDLSLSYRVGAEIRPLKFISLQADWKKAAGTYSNWDRFGGIRFALNLLLGAGQRTFRQTKTNGPAVIPSLYPMLIAKDQSGKIIDDGDDTTKPPTFINNVKIEYVRVEPFQSTEYIDANVRLEIGLAPYTLVEGWQHIQNALMTKVDAKNFYYIADKLPKKTKLWVVVQDHGRPNADSPDLNGKIIKILGVELTDRYILKAPSGNNWDVACFIIQEDGSVTPWQ